MAAIGPDEIRTLEQIRQRLQTLNSSITALQTNFYEVQPLPTWCVFITQDLDVVSQALISLARSSLQSHSGLISNNLQAVAKQLADNQQLLSSLVAYPLPQYPKSQAHLLEHLLRTKLEPEVEEWVEKGQEIAQKASKERYSGLSEPARDELWQWAPIAANDEIRKQNWGGDYTMAEKQSGIENVVTGLRRELQEPPDPEEQDEVEGADESEEADDDEEDVVEIRRKPNAPGLEFDLSTAKRPTSQMPIENIFRFMVTGNTAPGRPP
jgi:mediator of RNA polymerase II transcription subunit 8, fungi type